MDQAHQKQLDDYVSRPQSAPCQATSPVDAHGRRQTVRHMTDKLNPEAMAYFRRQGARGGRIGAAARMVKLTPEQRSDIARKAVQAREEKRNGKKLKPTAPSKSGSPVKSVQPKRKRKVNA